MHRTDFCTKKRWTVELTLHAERHRSHYDPYPPPPDPPVCYYPRFDRDVRPWVTLLLPGPPGAPTVVEVWACYECSLEIPGPGQSDLVHGTLRWFGQVSQGEYSSDVLLLRTVDVPYHYNGICPNVHGSYPWHDDGVWDDNLEVVATVEAEWFLELDMGAMPLPQITPDCTKTCPEAWCPYPDLSESYADGWMADLCGWPKGRCAVRLTAGTVDYSVELPPGGTRHDIEFGNESSDFRSHGGWHSGQGYCAVKTGASYATAASGGAIVYSALAVTRASKLNTEPGWLQVPYPPFDPIGDTYEYESGEEPYWCMARWTLGSTVGYAGGASLRKLNETSWESDGLPDTHLMYLSPGMSVTYGTWCPDYADVQWDTGEKLHHYVGGGQTPGDWHWEQNETSEVITGNHTAYPIEHPGWVVIPGGETGENLIGKTDKNGKHPGYWVDLSHLPGSPPGVEMFGLPSAELGTVFRRQVEIPHAWKDPHPDPGENWLYDKGEPYFHLPDSRDFGDWRCPLWLDGLRWDSVRITHHPDVVLWDLGSTDAVWQGSNCQVDIWSGYLRIVPSADGAWAEGNFNPGNSFAEGGTKLTQPTQQGDDHLHVVSTDGFPDSGELVLDEDCTVAYTSIQGPPDPQFRGCTGVEAKDLTQVRKVELVGPWLSHYRYVRLNWSASDVTAPLRVYLGDKYWDLGYTEEGLPVVELDLCKPHGLVINGVDTPLTLWPPDDSTTAEQWSFVDRYFPRSLGHKDANTYWAYHESTADPGVCAVSPPVRDRTVENEWYWGVDRVNRIKFSGLKADTTYLIGTLEGFVKGYSKLVVADQCGWRDDPPGREQDTVAKARSGVRPAPAGNCYVYSDEMAGWVITDGKVAAELTGQVWWERTASQECCHLAAPPNIMLYDPSSDTWSWALGLHPSRPGLAPPDTIELADSQTRPANTYLTQAGAHGETQLTVASTAGFPAAGRLTIAQVPGAGHLTYEATDATHFYGVGGIPEEGIPAGTHVVQTKLETNERDVRHLYVAAWESGDLTGGQTVTAQIRLDRLGQPVGTGPFPWALRATKRFGYELRGLVFQGNSPRPHQEVEVKHGTPEYSQTTLVSTDQQGHFVATLPRQPDECLTSAQVRNSVHNPIVRSYAKQRRRMFCGLVDAWGGAGGVDLCVAPYGRVYRAYEQAGQIWTGHSDNGGLAWTERGVGGSDGAVTPAIDCDKTGQLWLVYERAGTVWMRNSRSEGDDWSAEVDVGTGSHPEVFCDPRSEIIIILRVDATSGRIYGQRRSAFSWLDAEPFVLTDGQSELSTSDDRVSLAALMDAAGRIGLQYRKPDGTLDFRVSAANGANPYTEPS